MPTYEIKRGAARYRVEVDDGRDPNVVLDEALGLPSLVPEDADIPESLEAANERRGKPTFAESAARGAGLATRNVAFAPARVTAGLADLAAAVTPLPGGNREFLDAQLDQFLPSPSNTAERAVEAGADAVSGGVTAATALAARIPQAARTAQLARNVVPSQSAAGGLVDEIGASVLDSPGAFVASELAAGSLAEAALEATAESENPVVRVATPVVAGIAGGLAPATTVQGARALGRGARRALDPVTPDGAERAAARHVQALSADPEADAAALRAAPTGTRVSSATDNEAFAGLEKTAARQDPVAARDMAANAAKAEQRALDDLANVSPQGSDRAAWQQEVIVRGAPDNAAIDVGPPDEMLDDVAKSFSAAYDEAAGFPVRTENVQVEGGNVSLRELFDTATKNRTIRAEPKWRKNMKSFLDGLLDDLATGRKTDSGGVTEVQSQTLLKVRTLIRDELRVASRSSKAKGRADAKMLRAADEAVTTVLESQLPKAASDALRATDARYRQFLVIQDAMARSGDKGLTPEALRMALKAANTKGAVARGQTGELGRQATAGRDVVPLMGKNKDEEIKTVVRAMTPEQAKAARGDMVNTMVGKASVTGDDGVTSVKGKGLLQQLEKNRSSLKAAGMSDSELQRLDILAKRLATTQRTVKAGTDPAAPKDGLGFLMSLFTRQAAAKAAQRVVRGAGTGAAGILTTTGLFRQRMENAVRQLSHVDSDKIISEMIQDKDKFAALLVKETDSPAMRRKALKTIQAWVANVAPELAEDAEDE